MKINEMIRALRCASAVHAKDEDGPDCASCPFCLMEEVKEDIPIKEDAEIDGVKVWICCDGDRIMQEAAEMLESLCREETEPEDESMKLEELGLTTRCYNALKRRGVDTIGQMAAMGYTELMLTPHIGRKCLAEVAEVLDRNGFEMEW